MKKLLFAFLAIALLLSGCADKPYVIVQVADAQLGFSAAEKSQRTGQAYVNDLSYESGYLNKAVDLINEMLPDAVVFTGDQVNYPDNEEQWEAFAGIISRIDGAVKVFHLPGNHDVHIGSEGVDSSPFTSRYGDDRFIHSDGNVILVGLNTNLIKSGDRLEEEQISWLKASLGGDEKDCVTVLFGHHPFFMTDIDEEDSYFPIMKDRRRFYFDMFAESGVDAVYAGHCHNSFEGEYKGIPMKTTTSVAFQIGDSRPSVRVIRIEDGRISDELVEICRNSLFFAGNLQSL